MSKHIRVKGWYQPHDSFGYDGSVVDPITGEVTTPPSRTKQSFLAECDINNIIRQYSQTGVITHISAKASQGVYADLPDTIDFQESMNTVVKAQEAFASLPAAVRARFANEPSLFLEFMADPANLEEARKLGLLKAAQATGGVQGGNPPPAPQTAPAANSEAPGSSGKPTGQ